MLRLCWIFFREESNSEKMYFDNIVTNANMQLILGYNIPEESVPFIKGKEKVEGGTSEVPFEEGEGKSLGRPGKV